MGFVVAGNTSATAGEPIANNGFWPEIDPAHFRATHRVDSTVTEDRAQAALQSAIIHANHQLREWQKDKVDAGYEQAKDVPDPAHQPQGTIIVLYQRAVYGLAKANLTERYRDYDTTTVDNERAEDMATTIDDYRRDAAWAIADIVGRTHCTVELI